MGSRCDGPLTTADNAIYERRCPLPFEAYFDSARPDAGR